MKEVCKTFTPIAGCDTHNTPVVADDGSVTVTCQTCSPYYKRKTDGSGCDSISTLTGYTAGCASFDFTNNYCTSCESGKYLQVDHSSTTVPRTCLTAPGWAEANC